MTRRVGLVEYPGSVAEIGRDKDFLKAFAQFAKSEKIYLNSMTLCMSSADGRERYNNFLAEGAPYKIKVPASMQRAADIAFDTQDWGMDAYQLVMNFMQKECRELIDSKAFPEFFKSRVFIDYHCRKVTGYPDPNTAAENAADKLGVKRHTSVIGEIMLEILFGGRMNRIDQLGETLQEKTRKDAGAVIGMVRRRNRQSILDELMKERLIRI